MNKTYVKAIAFATSVAAFAVYDIKKWLDSEDPITGALKPFDLKKAVPRWILGALTGGAGALVINEIPD